MNGVKVAVFLILILAGFGAYSLVSQLATPAISTPSSRSETAVNRGWTAPPAAQGDGDTWSTAPSSTTGQAAGQSDNDLNQMLSDMAAHQNGESSAAPQRTTEPVETVDVVHGDLKNPADGRCYVKVFHNGVSGLGSGTYRIEHITGTPEEIDAQVQQISAGSARAAGMDCPVIE